MTGRKTHSLGSLVNECAHVCVCVCMNEIEMVGEWVQEQISACASVCGCAKEWMGESSPKWGSCLIVTNYDLEVHLWHNGSKIGN